jgi:hypothetical protein
MSWESTASTWSDHRLSASIDLVIGADVMYSHDCCYRVLSLVAQMIELRPSLVFLVTYQQRDSLLSITPFLDLFNLAAENIPLYTFLNKCHFDGFCLVRSEEDKERNTKKRKKKGSIVEGVSTMELQSFDSIFLLKITKK